MVALEENHFTTRIIASKFAGDTTLANDLEDLATNGRPDNSPILSVLQQYKSFTFPGWSPDKPMPATDAFIAGPEVGVIRISNRGTTADSVTTADTPTPDQVQSLASDLATSGTTYSKLSEVYPDALPAAQGQQGQGNPDQVGRIWTKPQEIDGVTLNMRKDSDPSNGQEHFVRRADIGDWSHSLPCGRYAHPAHSFLQFTSARRRPCRTSSTTTCSPTAAVRWRQRKEPGATQVSVRHTRSRLHSIGTQGFARAGSSRRAFLRRTNAISTTVAPTAPKFDLVR